MGLLNIFKGSKTSSNKKQILYVNQESLPNDMNQLEDMFDYYQSLYKKNNYEGYEEERHNIIRKMNEVGEKQIPYNPVNRGRFLYTLYLADSEEQASYYLDKFIYDIQNMNITNTMIANRNKKRNNDRELFIDNPYCFDHTLSGVEHCFTYHDDKELTDEMKEHNIFVEYYENHLDKLIDAICQVIETQKNSDHTVFTGYYMYLDLFDFLTTSDERYSIKIWERTRKYLDYVTSYYDYYLKINKESEFRYKSALTGHENRARREMNSLDLNDLHLAYQNLFKARELMKSVRSIGYISKDKVKAEECIIQITKHPKDIILSEKRKNDVGVLLSYACEQVENMNLCKKALEFLQSLNQYHYSNEESHFSLYNCIHDIEVQIRRIYIKDNNLPTFKISYLPIELFGKTIDSNKYYILDDGRMLINTSIFIEKNKFKVGDILECVETGERYILHVLNDDSEYSEDEMDDDLEMIYAKIEIIGTSHNKITGTNTFYKVK